VKDRGHWTFFAGGRGRGSNPLPWKPTPIEGIKKQGASNNKRGKEKGGGRDGGLKKKEDPSKTLTRDN